MSLKGTKDFEEPENLETDLVVNKTYIHNIHKKINIYSKSGFENVVTAVWTFS
jgi:hypothetical protein